ncbi:hypothetical protein Mh1960_06010 [Mannheimia haemolytica]
MLLSFDEMQIRITLERYNRIGVLKSVALAYSSQNLTIIFILNPKYRVIKSVIIVFITHELRSINSQSLICDLLHIFYDCLSQAVAV